MTELGIPDIQFMGWLGVIGSSALPADVTARINAAVLKVAGSPAFRERLQSVGLEPDIKPGSQQIADELREVSDRNAALVRQFNIRLN